MYKEHQISLLFKSFPVALLMVLVALNNVNAQQVGAGVYAYPAAGQSLEQQQKDQFECHQWAAMQTGFDPTRTPQTSSSNYAYTSPPSSSDGYFGSGETGQGGVVRDAAGGAALGAIGGAIAGDAGKGAAIGALAGGLFGGVKRSSRKSEEQRWREQQAYQAQQQQYAMTQQQQQRTDEYRRAYSICMSSRNYRVQ